MEETYVVTDNVSEIRGQKKNRNRRQNLFVGLALVLLALVGMIAIVVQVVSSTAYLLNNTRQKEQWEEFILPVVMYDPVPFSDPTTLNQHTLKQISIWAAMLGNSLDSFQRDENDYVIIPADEVDKQARLLFGPAVHLEHSTIGAGYDDVAGEEGSYDSSGVTIPYFEDTKTYHISLQEITTTDMYVPRVTRIEKEGDEIQLVVGYVSQPSLWDKEKDTSNRKPDKYFIHVIKTGTDGQQHLAAIREVPKDWEEADPNRTNGDGISSSGKEDGASSALQESSKSAEVG